MKFNFVEALEIYMQIENICQTHILPLRGAAEQHHAALGVQLSLLGLCRVAVGPILCRSLGGFHGNF